ncbi:MAG: HDIG domain-containing protein [Bacteroidetes bacterium]|nr:MAG: HDIG domain-containing protein [Bacteroidota bacterium]
MSKIIAWFQENFSNMVRFSLFASSVFLILLLFPRQTGFYWEFSQARPWLYEDLIAPFNFAILKSPAELAAERQEVIDELTPFFKEDPGIYERQFQLLINRFEIAWDETYPDNEGSNRVKEQNKKLLINIFDSIYNRGIIFLEGEMTEVESDTEILLLDGAVARSRLISDFFTIQEAFKFINTSLSEAGLNATNRNLLGNVLENSVTHSVFWDEQANARAMTAALERVSHTRGMVQQGEKIVSKGEIITDEKLLVLESYRAEYSRQLGGNAANYIVFIGQFLLVSISIVVLSLFLRVFRREVFYNSRKVIVILLSIYLMIFLTSQVVKYNINLLYLVPVCIVPIIVRSFFDNRLALYVHIISIIIIGFLVPKSFEFVFLQFIAGIIAILSIASLRRRSQLFFTVFLIFLTYSAIFTGLSLAQFGSFTQIDLINFVYFAGSALLTLFAYPLIYIFERTSGLPTDFSLLELSDTNSLLLRELNMQAPGTFQHSLQVANLSEEAINIIGGNSLMVRTGALYHDIGKMDQPQYFIENQNSQINPHDELSYTESAEIIIGHVIKGIEKARKYNLPEYIIDFIRTHHGTTTTRYFYIMEKKENPDKDIDPEIFRYKGPEPFSKETAVLMMADSVEAASRSMKNPSEENINKLVEGIIDTQVQEKQFDNANITFKDISTIKRVFKNRLMHIFHVRIAYPGLN